MHIITGLLVAKILKARMGGSKSSDSRGGLGSPLLNMPKVISLTHRLPGRCRFAIPALTGNGEAAQILSDKLPKIDGVEDVSISTVSGSVLIGYDCGCLNENLLAAVLVRLMGLEGAFSDDVESALSHELRDWGRSLNFAVYQKTGGMLDLRTALFLALAIMGMKKMIASRSLGFPAGFTMLWWASLGLFSDGGEVE